MIRCKSERKKKIVITDDERLFYIKANVEEEQDEEQRNKIKDSLRNSPSIRQNHLKKDSSIEYKIGNYLIQQTLGEGTFGKVKLGIYLPTNEKVAIKVLEKDRLTDKDDQIRVKREFDMLSKFNHPNVILVTEIFESLDSYYSVMEFCEGGELFNYIVDKKRLSEKETSFYYFQLINGLEYIHSLGIVHRDLKPENLLLTKEHLLKIIDFGLSNYYVENETELLRTPCGSPCYASPEMVAGKTYDGVKIDIWATGIILFAMLCGYLPFEDKINDILFDKILECKIEFPPYLSEESKDLINKILVVDPEKRISIPEIKKHSFFLKGKKLFDEVFTIKKIDENENNSCNKKDKNEVEEGINDNIVEEKKSDINKNNNKLSTNEKNQKVKNKENININNINNKKNGKNIDIEFINNNNQKIKNNNIKYNTRELFSYCNDKNNKREKIEEIKEIKNKNNKKPKELNNKYFQYIEKKANHKKINITDNSPNNYNANKNIPDKYYINKNPKNKKNKTPEIKNGKIIKLKEKTKIVKSKNNFLLDALNRERNTVGSIASIGSSLVETFNNLSQQTNITNFMVNNINYNVNISFDNTKRTYSGENTKDITQNEQTNKNLSINTIIKQGNNINIIDNINNINKSNNSDINNIVLFNHFNYNNNRINKNNRIRKINKIKKDLKDIKGNKHYNNSDNIKRGKQELDFNICKLINDSSIKKNYKEFLSKNKENNKKNKNNVSKSKPKDKKFYTNRENHTKMNKNKFKENIYINKKNYSKKKEIKHINKDISQNKNKNFSTINNNNSKNKNNKLMIKASNLNNNIDNKKKVNILQNINLYNHNSLDNEANLLNIKTEPNIKANFSKALNKLTKNSKKKNIINMVSRKDNKAKIYSPLKRGKIRQKLIKYNQINQLFNSSNKKQFETIHNIVTNYKTYKPELNSISHINKTTEKKIANIKIQNLNINNKKDEPNKLLEITSNSIEMKNNKEGFFKLDKNKFNNMDNNKNINTNNKQNNASCISNINNISNIESNSNYIKIANKTPNQSKNKSKVKNISKNKKSAHSKNEILIICSEHNIDKEKNKIANMNKFRNICCIKNNEEKEDLNNIPTKKAHIKKIQRIPHFNNNKDKNINIQKNRTHNKLTNNINHIISYSTRINNKRINTNVNHLKFNSMKINDIYKNNIKDKNKLKKVYLVDKSKKNMTNNNDEEIPLKNKGTSSNYALNKKHIISIKNYDNKK